jgi:hypothetical protein
VVNHDSVGFRRGVARLLVLMLERVGSQTGEAMLRRSVPGGTLAKRPTNPFHIRPLAVPVRYLGRLLALSASSDISTSDATLTMEVPMATRVRAKSGRKRSSQSTPSLTKCPNTKFTYRDLAWWAETADGYRDEELVIAETRKNGQVETVVKQKSAATSNGDRILIDGICTGLDVKPARPPASKVTARVNGKEFDCKSKDGVVCDSIFCTDSAIEKFLFLYYHSQRLLTPEEWAALNEAFNDPTVVLIGHVWPSRAVPLGQESGAENAFYIGSDKLGANGKPLWESLGEYRRRKRI